jgi:hypothetical protein
MIKPEKSLNEEERLNLLESYAILILCLRRSMII